MQEYSKLLGIIKSIQEKNKIYKKTIQKIVYLIECSGEGLGFDDYGIHYYGPYSSDLDYVIQKLSAYGDLNINITEKGHIIEVSEKCDSFSQELPDIVNKIINIFGDKNASELELIATALYIQRESNNSDEQYIIETVKRIKGEKYDIQKIKGAIKELRDASYF